MRSSERNVLVVAYRFPPMGGIGSRRWAKFSKYLARSGCKVHVITADYPWRDEVNWAADIENVSGISVTRLRTGYPQQFLRPPTGNRVYDSWTKIRRRIFHAIYRRRLVVDYASLWANTLVPFAIRYIREQNIQNVVFTGPPSSLHLIGAVLKSDVPSIRLIQDYRDPWNNVHDYSFRALQNVARKGEMLYQEALALQAADHIVVVTEQMSLELTSLFGIAKKKIAVIPNGFDPEDYLGTQECRKIHDEKIRLCYMGLFGSDVNGRLAGLQLLADAIETLPCEERRRFELHLYSELQPGYFASAASAVLRTQTTCHHMVSPTRVADIVANIDVGVAINRREDGYAIGTKVFEYMGAGKAILQITPPGEVATMLANAGQYVSGYHSNEAVTVIRKIAAAFTGVAGAAEKIDYSMFDVATLTERYMDILWGPTERGLQD